MTLRPHPMPQRPQRGVSLVVVMIMLLLGTVVVLGTTRLGWLNEIIVSSESDYQRAFAAAEALTRDAEQDIRGVANDNVTRCRDEAAFVGCREQGAGQPYFPEDEASDDWYTVQDLLAANGNVNGCLQGICMPPTVNTLTRATWGTEADVAAMVPVGATYGQYTRAAPAASGNPLLATNPARAWYWVEVFTYAKGGGIQNATGNNIPIPEQGKPYVYRITTFVQGLKPGTRVWLRSIYVPKPQNQVR
jgi:type IV pilus assembly protein PilX